MIPVVLADEATVLRVARSMEEIHAQQIELVHLVRSHEVVPLMHTRKTAAAYLGVSTKTIDHLVRTGDVRWVTIGNSRRIPRADLDAVADAAARAEHAALFGEAA